MLIKLLMLGIIINLVVIVEMALHLDTLKVTLDKRSRMLYVPYLSLIVLALYKLGDFINELRKRNETSN